MRVIHDELEATLPPSAFHSPQIPGHLQHNQGPVSIGSREIRRILMAHLEFERSIGWRTVHTLWNDYGIRHFVEWAPATS